MTKPCKLDVKNAKLVAALTVLFLAVSLCESLSLPRNACQREFATQKKGENNCIGISGYCPTPNLDIFAVVEITHCG